MRFVSAIGPFFLYSIIIFHSFTSFRVLKICGEFKFAKCLEILLLKIKENIEEARKQIVCLFKFKK